MILLLEDRYESPLSSGYQESPDLEISSKINHGAIGVGSKKTVAAYTPIHVMPF